LYIFIERKTVNLEQKQLYDRILAFSLDLPDAKLSFSKRLARDNRWSAEYTQRAIEEYKKFVFLAVTTGHPVTPSDQVDQVWHLHLLYTHSYWEEFCPNVLHVPLHHSPTCGGSSEHNKFNDWYSKTLKSYEYFFGQKPPADIWSNANVRFGHDVHFVRVNTQDNWIMPKLHLNSILARFSQLPLTRAAHALLFVLALTITGCEPLLLANIKNPLDFTGREFLLFYLILATTATIFVLLLRWYFLQSRHHPSVESVSLDPYEIAYLANGKDRTIAAAVACLVQQNYVHVVSDMQSLTLTTLIPDDSHPLERAIAKAIQHDGNIQKIKNYNGPAIDQIYTRLQNLGLLVSNEQAAVLRRCTIPILAVLLLGMIRIAVGIFRNKPVGFLILLCLITAIVGFQFLRLPPRSPFGERVLKYLKVRDEHLKQAIVNDTATVPQTILALALFGNEVLVNTSLTELKETLFPQPVYADVSGGGGSDGGCGGSGCGGSGCGGGGCGGGGCGGCGG
jgi:uncharacterized protein (TIGR04222 family)